MLANGHHQDAAKPPFEGVQAMQLFADRRAGGCFLVRLQSEKCVFRGHHELENRCAPSSKL